MPLASDHHAVLRRALDGENVTLDSDRHSLHQITQVAAALNAGANLIIHHGRLLTPLERATIQSVGRGHISFL